MHGRPISETTLALWRTLSTQASPSQSPLGWDWLAARVGLVLRPRPSTAELMRLAGEVLAQETECLGLDDIRLRERLERHRQVFRRGVDTPADLVQALIAIREAAYRARGERAYLCQVAGALGILRGCVVEMATGEGKTLTAALAATIQGWRGHGCHVVTANDYLAGRDAESMEPIYAFCRASVAAVTQASSRDDRGQAYSRDIVYLTSREALADFLRDRMELGGATTLAKVLARSLAGEAAPELMQRGLGCAIVDEADNVLCDGGSTPLIISSEGDRAGQAEAFRLAADIATCLKPGKDFLINPVFREASLTETGRTSVLDAAQKRRGVWGSPHRAQEMVVQAVEAREFFLPSVHYIVRDGKVVIVDEATGRIMPDHEWRDGMHQAVAAKEGLDIVPPRATSAQSTFQEFLRRYRHLGGMTGTAWEARGEFLQFYDMFTVRIPPNRPCRRTERKLGVYPGLDRKIEAVAEEVRRVHGQGRPVLVGTRSIEMSEVVSEVLSRSGLAHEVLNAVHHAREAEIVALAGRPGAVTVATNMAGRGTDIKIPPEVADLGGLYVILTDRHASARVDRQLRGRCARQGDPGTTVDLLSLDDPVLDRCPAFLRRAIRRLLTVPSLASPVQWLVWRLADILQWLSDQSAVRARRQLLRASRHMADLTSFTGKQA